MALAIERLRRRNSGPGFSTQGPTAAVNASMAPLLGEVALFGMSHCCHTAGMGSAADVDRPEPGFGRTFTPHMVTAHYRDGAWSGADVVPFEALSLSPAAMVLHYGQAIFEGLKAYRQPDGGVALFRPDLNAARFDRSAERLAMPRLPDGLLVDACRELVRIDDSFVPAVDGQSLYLRPTMIATETGLGVRAADEYLFLVIASPAGSYFPSGVKPLTVWVADQHIRAARDGTGAAKTAGNYAGSLAAKADAVRRGCDDVLFLDARDRRWVEELSGMNIVFVSQRDGRTELTAPPPDGTILDGVTRRSLLELAAHLGFDVIERPVAVDEVLGGAFGEAFACGTAAVVAPIGAVRSVRGTCLVGDGEVGPVTQQLRRALVHLQEGKTDDPFGWRVPVATQPAILV